MNKDPFTQETTEKDEFPKFIAQGSILKAVFKEITAFNEDREWTEVFLIVQIDNGKFMCISFYTGNRWMKEVMNGESNGTIKAESIINLLKKTPNVELSELRVISHLNDIDIWSFVA